MKISVCSDVHLEFGFLDLKNIDEADVLILSGDIMIASELPDLDFSIRAEKFAEFFDQCSSQFKHVIYIMGNHEHYHGDYALSANIIREFVNKRYNNVYFLDKEVKVIDDVTFIGGTLWTDMNEEDRSTMRYIVSYMNDYRTVMNSNNLVSYKKEVLINKPVGMTDEEFLLLPHESRYTKVFGTRPGKLTPEDTVEDHKCMLAVIDETTKDSSKKYVVVGHHAPSKLSTKPQYEKDVLVNGAYSSDLTEFIINRPQIKVWTHGHTHHPFDYMIGSTRIFCNPRGYINYEEQADLFNLKTIEV